MVITNNRWIGTELVPDLLALPPYPLSVNVICYESAIFLIFLLHALPSDQYNERPLGFLLSALTL
jgi:hypothetical protein